MFEIESIGTLSLQLAVVSLWLAGIILAAEGIYQYTHISSEVVRKIVHIGTGNVILFAWWLEIPAWVAIGASAVAATVALLSYHFEFLPGINSIGRKSLGTFFYAVSIGVLVAWFWPVGHPEYAAIGILVMAYGDGLAALIGQHFGKHPYRFWGEKKSVEGSLTMAMGAYFVSILILIDVRGNSWEVWAVSLAIAVLATVLEAFSKLGIDNLTVPLASAGLAFFLSQWF
ncbi:phosphatidate cytidylyltransferase [Oxynema sp. CENA135]|uniref:diacylglycerol/polyprenol kinase family protein n=1 Tax=Oxynema sp. CENA135 TaxID=984206 RepID=UPI00190CBA46|nr:phosphatidate cytidylyltransferase [Oxynema sp. CENA135]